MASRSLLLLADHQLAADWVSHSMLNVPLRRPPVSRKVKGIADDIRVSCGDQTFDFIRSEDLTIESLKNEVARLMWCNPCQLIIVASEVDLEMDMQSAVLEPDALIFHTEGISFQIQDVINLSEGDEEMQDVGHPEDASGGIL